MPFEKIWYESRVFQDIRDVARLRGKCGICEYRNLCGGCRARAYALGVRGRLAGSFSSEPDDYYLDQDPWCTYVPPHYGRLK